MIRQRLKQALTEADTTNNERFVSTIRLVLAALKERDHCAREFGNNDGISEPEVLAMIQDMVKQRRAEIARCEERGMIDLADQEAEEIDVLSGFLPHQMTDAEMHDAVQGMILELEASKLKDTGRVIKALKDRYPGQMDFGSAKKQVCQRLSSS